MAEIEIRAERLEQYEQKAIEKQHNRRKNQMLNQGFSVSNFAWAAEKFEYRSAEFREITKFSFSTLNCHFLGGNHRNNYLGEFPDFHEFTLYMNFANFLKIDTLNYKKFQNFQIQA